MKRGDAAVISISVGLAAVAVAGVVFSLRYLDRMPANQLPASDNSQSSLLVLTWGPSLCQVEKSNAGCRSGHVDKLGGTFILHGLWPQPQTEQYCGVPRQMPDRARKPVTLPGDLAAELESIMSDSDRMTTHEWYAHGTCSGVDPGRYFGIATELTTQADRVLRPVFNRAVGQRLSSRSVREAVDAALGAGSGKRVSMSCRKAGDGTDIVYEVRLSLPTVAALTPTDGQQPSLAGALAEGPLTQPGCGQGRVP
ncbi:MAG: ribonuclease T(2) [Mycobacteriaceae bacterium]